MSIDNLSEIGSYVSANLHTITNALANHAARMEGAAKEARAAYEQGQADPEVREAQDQSMITNRGYLGAATAFTQDADQSRLVARELEKLVVDSDDEDVA